jgi:hypothetical protein
MDRMNQQDSVKITRFRICHTKLTHMNFCMKHLHKMQQNQEGMKIDQNCLIKFKKVY